MARLIVMRRGGGGKVAVNPEQVSHVRSASGAFTDIFIGDQQIAVEGTFEEVVARLTTPNPRLAAPSGQREGDGLERKQDEGFVFGRIDR